MKKQIVLLMCLGVMIFMITDGANAGRPVEPEKSPMRYNVPSEITSNIHHDVPSETTGIRHDQPSETTSINKKVLMVPQQYATIEEAMDTAVDGDVIMVSTGASADMNLNFQVKQITFISAINSTSNP